MSAAKREAAPSGLLLVNKQAGVTSFEALSPIKRALATGKVGHTGTLDKFAQGLLVVLSGNALKLSQWFSNCDKQYEACICFGIETDTLDPEGEIVSQAPLPSREAVEKILCRFIGPIMQTPPVYSAIHVNGKRASALARSGQAPEMKERQVHIYSLTLRSWDSPLCHIHVHCSSGTYIRSLARDIARAVGCCAHLSGLTRTHVAGFRLADAVSSDASADSLYASLRPLDRELFKALGLALFEVSTEDAEKIIHGRPLSLILDNKQPVLPDPASQFESRPGFSVAVFSDNTFIAIVEKTGDIWKYGYVNPATAPCTSM